MKFIMSSKGTPFEVVKHRKPRWLPTGAGKRVFDPNGERSVNIYRAVFVTRGKDYRRKAVA